MNASGVRFQLGQAAARLGLLMALCLAAPVCGSAQAFELSVGASTIYSAEGATLLVHGQNTETSVGGGLQGHHFSVGGTTERRLKQGSESLGLQSTRADVPTDIFNQSHLFVGIGAGIVLRGNSSRTREFRTFAGFSSIDGGTPLFRSGSIDRPAAFAQWSRQISAKCRAVSTALYLRRVIGLESIECLPEGPSKVRLAVTAGGGPGGLYGAASYAFEGDNLRFRAAYVSQMRHFDRNTVTWGAIPEPVGGNLSVEYRLSGGWSISGLRQKFFAPAYIDPITPDRNTSEQQTDLEQGGSQFHWRGGSIGGTALHAVLHTPAMVASPATLRSTIISMPPVSVLKVESMSGEASSIVAVVPTSSSNLSLAVNFEQFIGPVRWTENLVRSYSFRIGPETLLISGLSFRLNSHLTLSEMIDSTDGRLTMAHGGDLVTPAGSFHVDHELLYLVNRPQKPFQQATLVNAKLRLWHSIAAELASSIEPTGRVGYTVRLTTFHARSSIARPESDTHMGVNMIAGMVVDETGAPVPGAALMIGETHFYTDDSGLFSLRERKAMTHPLHVLTDEFLIPGSFIVLSAPSSARSVPQLQSTPLRIILKRKTSTRDEESKGLTSLENRSISLLLLHAISVRTM